MLGVVSGALSVLRSARTVTQWQHVAALSASVKTASVLAVVPARSEEATLPSLLSGLFGQPGVRVVVVDDSSADSTASVARSGGAEVIESSGPAFGWAGKTHAMHLGVQAAQDEEWLLFMDADVTCTPDLVRRTVFLAAGGWETLAGTHADDVGLATLIRDSGGVTRFVDASALLTTSGIDTFGDCWRSLRKSIQPSMREMFGPCVGARVVGGRGAAASRVRADSSAAVAFAVVVAGLVRTGRFAS